MKKPNEFSTNFDRIHMQWLHRQLVSSARQAEAHITQLTGPTTTNNDEKLQEARNYLEEVTRLEQAVGNRLQQGEKDRIALAVMKEELEEALELNPEAHEEINRRLKSLPKEEPYRITFDQNTAKMVLKMIDNDLQKFKSHVIPAYQKKSEEDLKDPVLNKTYWLNKAAKAVKILDRLKKTIEQELG